MGGKETLTWEEFLNACSEFKKLTENLEQSWQFVGQMGETGNGYLKYSTIQRLPSSSSSAPGATSTEIGRDDSSGLLVSCEYHILYNMSYSVPTLYFTVSHPDGRLMSLDEIWSIFHSKDGSSSAVLDMWSTISQQDHPVLHVPYFTFHPCHTAALMGKLPYNPQNPALSYLITWLSVVGGKIGLSLPNEFAKVVGDNNSAPEDCAAERSDS